MVNTRNRLHTKFFVAIISWPSERENDMGQAERFVSHDPSLKDLVQRR